MLQCIHLFSGLRARSPRAGPRTLRPLGARRRPRRSGSAAARAISLLGSMDRSCPRRRARRGPRAAAGPRRRPPSRGSSRVIPSGFPSRVRSRAQAVRFSAPPGSGTRPCLALGSLAPPAHRGTRRRPPALPVVGGRVAQPQRNTRDPPGSDTRRPTRCRPRPNLDPHRTPPPPPPNPPSPPPNPLSRPRALLAAAARAPPPARSALGGRRRVVGHGLGRRRVHDLVEGALEHVLDVRVRDGE